MSNGRELWPRLEKELTQLLEAIKPSLDKRTIGIVKDFIENNEFGVALDWLYYYIIENNVQLPFQHLQHIRELGNLMEIDL